MEMSSRCGSTASLVLLIIAAVATTSFGGATGAGIVTSTRPADQPGSDWNAAQGQGPSLGSDDKQQSLDDAFWSLIDHDGGDLSDPAPQISQVSQPNADATPQNDKVIDVFDGRKVFYKADHHTNDDFLHTLPVSTERRRTAPDGFNPSRGRRASEFYPVASIPRWRPLAAYLMKYNDVIGDPRVRRNSIRIAERGGQAGPPSGYAITRGKRFVPQQRRGQTGGK